MVLGDTDRFFATLRMTENQRAFGEKAVNGFVSCQGPEFCLWNAFVSTERQHYPLDADVFRREDFFFP